VRVLFTSIRGLGHFQPLVPLIEACLSAGHDVAVSTPRDLEARVAKTGATFLPFGHPGDEGLQPLWRAMREVPARERNGFVMQHIFGGACAKFALPDLLTHVQTYRPHVLVREAQEYAALVAGPHLGVPTVRVGISLEASLEEWAPFVLAALAEHETALGAKAGGAQAALTSERILTQFPRALWPEDPRHGLFRFRIEGAARAAGPLPFPRPAGWSDDAMPLVYLTLGTVASTMDDLRSAYRLVLDAVATLPVRAVLTTGEALDPAELAPVPDRVFATRFVPQAELLPHVAAVVCHGGSGTVLGTLAAGVPMVVLPLFADQPQNAERVEAIGAGVSVDYSSATPQALATALERVLGDPSFKERARAVAADMASLPHVVEAPAWLEHQVAGAV